ncbi:MAG: hypothetical protein KatS3mg057_1170 [Herpetosiphonaceae bacterium]|nr:MAG: hypothetical protein KatS3mg057_1170 [Herpetosiphonaceae bacterium]
MIIQALDDFQANPAECLMVGDMEADRTAAKDAGVPFRWAADFFGWSDLDSDTATLLE